MSPTTRIETTVHDHIQMYKFAVQHTLQVRVFRGSFSVVIKFEVSALGFGENNLLATTDVCEIQYRDISLAV